MEEDLVKLDSDQVINGNSNQQFFLVPDSGVSYQIACPGTLTVGKHPNNAVVVDHYSASHHHAIVFSKFNDSLNLWEIFLKNLDSMNDTFAGPSVADLDKCMGVRQLVSGDILCFGSSNQTFRFIESFSGMPPIHVLPFYETVDPFVDLPNFKRPLSAKIKRIPSSESWRTESTLSSSDSVKLPEIRLNKSPKAVALSPLKR
jgi:hypothetical protein